MKVTARPRAAPFVPLDFPAWIEWRVRRGARLPHPPHLPERGPHGRRFCRWCAVEVGPRRHAWCSEACVRKFLRVATWADLCVYVAERDRHRCRGCLTAHPGWRHTDAWPVRYGDPNVMACHLSAWAWEVDHIVPVRRGGTDHPDNLRLGCHACHVAWGYEQRAAERRTA